MGFQKKVIQRKAWRWKVGGTVGTDCDSAATAAGVYQILAAPAKTIVRRVYCVVSTATTGATAWRVGDTGVDNGYILTVHGQAAGVYPSGAEDTSFIGSYLGASTAGGVNATDPSRSEKVRFVAAATDISLTIAGTASAGDITVYIDFEVTA